MTQNNLITAAAVGFAGFALWYITRTPGNSVAASKAQAQRDAALQTFNDQTSGNYADWYSSQSAVASGNYMKFLLGN